MSYIGNPIVTAAFLTDQFSGTGSQTAFTLSAAPANTASILVAVSGVLQDPTTYSVSGTTLTFSAAPPSGTGNISARFLGIPASGVTTTAYRTLTEFTATAGQTTFTPPSYTVGYITVLRNGVQLGTADFTATNGTTVVLASGATAGDLITTISFYVSSVLNAIPNTYQSVGWTNLPSGSVLQVVNTVYSTLVSQGADAFVNTGLTASITPKFTTSKVLILVNQSVGRDNANNAARLQITRGGTGIQTFADYAGFTGSSFNFYGWTNSLVYLDSPATTSSTTYATQIRNLYAAGAVYAQPNGSQSSITLLEITQ